MPPDFIEAKAALRRQMKAQRAAFPLAAREVASHQINAHLMAWLENRSETGVALFLAQSGEPDLEPTARFLLTKGVTVAAPRVDLARQTMRFFALQNWGDWETGPFGVRQPIDGLEIEDISLVLVPGLAFDRSGGRLGMGGGWYDRVLPHMGLAIGVAFEWQIVAQVPTQAHDAHVHGLVTENQGVSWMFSQLR